MQSSPFVVRDEGRVTRKLLAQLAERARLVECTTPDQLIVTLDTGERRELTGADARALGELLRAEQWLARTPAPGRPAARRSVARSK